MYDTLSYALCIRQLLEGSVTPFFFRRYDRLGEATPRGKNPYISI